MIESPLLREIDARGQARGRIEARVEDILRVLTARFEMVPPEIRESLARIQDERALEALVTHAALCANVADFRAHLPSCTATAKVVASSPHPRDPAIGRTLTGTCL